jgi:UDP-N-acetylmuramoyl-tripeptide--D-alanyl-D-alanine ligase
VVGEAARPIHLGVSGTALEGSRSVLVADTEAAAGWLRHELHPGDVVLFKASNAVQLSRVAQAVLEEPGVEEGSR